MSGCTTCGELIVCTVCKEWTEEGNPCCTGEPCSGCEKFSDEEEESA